MKNTYTLYKGDTVSVISPSKVFNMHSKSGTIAKERLEKGFAVSIKYGVINEEEANLLSSTSIESRINDLHGAFLDSSVKAIICSSGGFNANDLIPYIDWDIIKNNPKPFVGSSDITVLLNAIYTKTGITTFHGPNFFKYGMKIGIEYSLEYLQKAIFSEEAYTINPSKEWSEDKWYKDQENRTFQKNEGHIILNEGDATGTILGGNLCSFNLLQGTDFMPSLKDSILFLEDDDFAGADTFGEFYRNFQSLLQQPESGSIKGIAFGRFFSACEMNKEKLQFIIQSNKRLKNIPIISNVDFGHIDPAITFPVGGTAYISTVGGKGEIKILSR